MCPGIYASSASSGKPSRKGGVRQRSCTLGFQEFPDPRLFLPLALGVCGLLNGPSSSVAFPLVCHTLLVIVVRHCRGSRNGTEKPLKAGVLPGGQCAGCPGRWRPVASAAVVAGWMSAHRQGLWNQVLCSSAH